MMKSIVPIKILKLMYKSHKFASISGCFASSATPPVLGRPPAQAAHTSGRSQ